MLVASQAIPALQEYTSPVKQAQIERDRAAIEYTRGPQTDVARSAVRENETQIAERQANMQRAKQQDAADAEFTRQYNAARQSNPTATINQLAGLAGEIAARTGASEKVIKPIMDAFGTAGQLSYHQESIKVRREEIAAQQSQFRQSLDRGDTNTARQIVADEVRSHQAVIKETESRIKASEKLLSDPLVSQADKAAIKAQIAADKEQLDKVDRAALKDAQGRLRNLFAGTRAGQQVIAREPPAPPPGAAPPAARQPQPRTLEEYRRLRGG
jgi:hypothetical protein